MIDLTPYIGLMLDIGNVIFFIVNFPQLLVAYRSRKDLKGLSRTMLVGYMIATIFFALVGVLTGGYLATTLCAVNEVIYMAQLYWSWKYRKRK